MKLPKNLYSRLTLITSVTLVTGYGIVYAWTTLNPVDAGANKPLTAALMQGIVNNINELNTNIGNITTNVSGLATNVSSFTGKLWTLTNGKWCTTDGTKIDCTSNAPAGGGTNLWNTGATNSINYTAGNVGIGTASPGVKLDVVWEMRWTNGTFTDATSQSTTTGAIRLSGVGGAIVLDDAGQKRISWNDGGGNMNIRAGNYVQAWTGAVFAKGASDANGGAVTVTMNSDGVDWAISLNVASAGVPGMPITWNNSFAITPTTSYFSTGNVGIGTTSPSYKIDVTGQSRIGNNVAQAAPSATNILSTAHVMLGGNGGNYLTMGQYDASKNYAAWLQSSYLNPAVAMYNMILQPLGGNVGIGTASPSKLLHLATPTGTNAEMDIQSGTKPKWGMYHDETSEQLRFWNNSDRVTFSSGGNVGIGTTTPNYSGWAGTVQSIAGNGNAANSFWVLEMANTRTTPASGDEMWALSFVSSNNGTEKRGALISSYLSGLGGPNGFGGTLYFNTKQDNATTTNMAMAILPSGNVGIGTATPSDTLQVAGNVRLGSNMEIGRSGGHYDEIGYNVGFTTTGNSYTYKMSDTAAAIRLGYGGGIEFRTAPTGTAGNSLTLTNVMTLSQVGNATLVGTLSQSSDKRLKTDINPIGDSLSKINSLAGVTYFWKDKARDPGRQIGVIAQDVEKIFPEAVKTDKEGFKSVTYGNLVAPIIEAIKELSHKLDELFAKYLDQQKQIDELKARMDALEHK